MRRWLTNLIVTLAISAASCPIVLGEQATEFEMENVARNWVTEMTLRTSNWAGETTPVLGGVHEISQDGTLLARYYDVSPRGYVVVPVLKEINPVMLYSDESNLDASQEGGMLQLIRDVLTERMELFRQAFGDLNAVQPAIGDVPFDRSQRARWDRLAVTAREFRPDQSQAVLAEGGPLITSSWHQRAPYNNDCPMGDGARSVVGCTATSLSQILDFWEWPSNGIGSHSYDWGGDNCNGGSVPGQTLSADFSDSYDWANIPDSCDGTVPCTAAQEAALAELCHEAGVAVNMNYGACASAAGMDMTVFPTYFKYSPSVTREFRTSHTQQSWFDIIRSEIDSGRVMWYHINSHAIVCDGYRDNGGQLEYHMNYGWGQGNNAWYVLDNLYCYWISGNICPYEQEDVTIHIEPQRTPSITYYGRTQDDSAGDNDGLAEAGETIGMAVTITNTGEIATNATGLLSTTDPYLSITTATAPFNPSFGWGEMSTSTTPFAIGINSSCPNPHIALLNLQVTDTTEYSMTQTLPMFIGTKPGWSDDLEIDQGYWDHHSIRMSYSDEWHLETSRTHSGSTSLKFGGVGLANYSNASDGGLVTPPFLLAAGSKLKFWHWMRAENDAGTAAWDGGIVMISNGDGNWTQIFPEGGYPYTILRNAESPFEFGTPCYSGSFDWSEAVFDLSAYSGVVQIMFRFGADGYVNFEGWYVDDIWVGTGTCCQSRVGDANGLGGDEPTIGDISVMIDAKFITGTCDGIVTCLSEADMNQSGGSDPVCDDITIGDISILIDYLFITGSAGVTLPNCL